MLVLFWRRKIEEALGDALKTIEGGYGSLLRVAQFKTDGQRTPTRYVRGVPELVLFNEQDAAQRPPRNQMVGAKIENLTAKGIGDFLKEHKIINTPPV